MIEKSEDDNEPENEEEGAIDASGFEEKVGEIEVI